MGDRHVGGGHLSAFLDDELGDARAMEVARHVADCGHCRRELDDLRVTRAALRQLPHLQAPVLTREVRAPASLLGSAWRRLRWATACAVAATVLTGAIYLVGDDGDVVPPVDVFLVDHVARTGGGPVPSPVAGIQR